MLKGIMYVAGFAAGAYATFAIVRLGQKELLKQKLLDRAKDEADCPMVDAITAKNIETVISDGIDHMYRMDVTDEEEITSVVMAAVRRAAIIEQNSFDERCAPALA